MRRPMRRILGKQTIEAIALIGLLAAAGGALSPGELVAQAGPPRQQPRYLEAPDDPPSAANPRLDLTARTPGMHLTFGSFVSVQVNVDELGFNIVGDAANEPSIAVDPLNGDNLVIGWRQFDNVASNFRQAGMAYSSNGGANWTFPGVLDPGIFRSDPVLDTNLEGTFFYNSLLNTFDMDVWRSGDGGTSWLSPVAAFGGDKNWLVVDKSLSFSSGTIYGIWQRFFGCCGHNTVIRSIDNGDSYEFPEVAPSRPTFGTLAVGPDGTLFAAGIEGIVTQDLSTFVVDRRVPGIGWAGGRVELGGSMRLQATPNPAGLLGQANVAVDHSAGETAGNVYLLASVDPPGGDPMDVHLARSEDGGVTWSDPIRVNDDSSTSNWQWLGAHSVAPNGRIDVVWYDTRNSQVATLSQLFYAYSWDGGSTWSENVAVSPVFDSTIGWPNQSKIGDYITIVSNEEAADVAYAATFNGEQDVYHVSVFPDCNENGAADLVDLAGESEDANGDHVPDECIAELVLTSDPTGTAGRRHRFTVSQGTPGETVRLAAGINAGSTPITGCVETLDLISLRILGNGTVDSQGNAVLKVRIPRRARGWTMLFQAFEPGTCQVSNLNSVEFSSPPGSVPSAFPLSEEVRSPDRPAERASRPTLDR